MTDTMTINMAPHSAVYSPHVRELKAFVESLSEMLNESKESKGTDYRRIVLWLDGMIEPVRKAMGDVLTDDFLLIVDGKRLPGGRRNDID